MRQYVCIRISNFDTLAHFGPSHNCAWDRLAYIPIVSETALSARRLQGGFLSQFDSLTVYHVPAS